MLELPQLFASLKYLSFHRKVGTVPPFRLFAIAAK